jgi:hypothetical protein
MNELRDIADECYRLRVTDGRGRERAVAAAVESYVAGVRAERDAAVAELRRVRAVFADLAARILGGDNGKA